MNEKKKLCNSNEPCFLLCYSLLKAVFLRNCRRHPEVETDLILKELDKGDQLEPMDIELALKDPEIHSVPLYAGADAEHADDKAVATQLYFGPGFEERLELEMDE